MEDEEQLLAKKLRETSGFRKHRFVYSLCSVLLTIVHVIFFGTMTYYMVLGGIALWSHLWGDGSMGSQLFNQDSLAYKMSLPVVFGFVCFDAGLRTLRDDVLEDWELIVDEDREEQAMTATHYEKSMG